jgi:hypothetical protein
MTYGKRTWRASGSYKLRPAVTDIVGCRRDWIASMIRRVDVLQVGAPPEKSHSRHRNTRRTCAGIRLPRLEVNTSHGLTRSRGRQIHRCGPPGG